MNINVIKKGFLHPIKVLWNQAGTKFMLASCIAFSLAFNLHKAGILISDPLVWAAGNIFARTLIMFVICLYLGIFKEIYGRNIIRLSALGSISALNLLCGLFSLQYLLVAYVAALKRTSIFLSILFGHFMFKEKDIKSRLLGAFCMLCGLIIIAIEAK